VTPVVAPAAPPPATHADRFRGARLKDRVRQAIANEAAKDEQPKDSPAVDKIDGAMKRFRDRMKNRGVKLPVKHRPSPEPEEVPPAPKKQAPVKHQPSPEPPEVSGSSPGLVNHLAKKAKRQTPGQPVHSLLHFEDLDANHDESITRDEFDKVLPNGVEPSPTDLARTPSLFLHGPEGAANSEMWCSAFFDDYWKVLRAEHEVLAAVDSFASELQTLSKDVEGGIGGATLGAPIACVNQTDPSAGCVNETLSDGPCFTNNTQNETIREAVPCVLIADPDVLHQAFHPNCTVFAKAAKIGFGEAASLVSEKGDKKLRVAIEAKFAEMCQSSKSLAEWECESHAAELAVASLNASSWCEGFWTDYYGLLKANAEGGGEDAAAAPAPAAAF